MVVIAVVGMVRLDPYVLYVAHDFEVECRCIWSFDLMMSVSKYIKDLKETCSIVT